MIVGDANLAEVATFLKVGTTALVLSMIEDDWLTRDLLPAKPVQALRHVSYDMTLERPIELADGSSITALEAQWELYDRARKFAEEHGLECIGGEDVGREVLRRWEEVLTGLETDPSTLSGQVDWIAKHRLLDGYRERHGLRWDDAKPGRHGPPVPRPPARRSRSPRASGSSASPPTRRPTRADDGAAARHPGLLPRPVPAALAREHRGRQLGLARVRRRWRSAAPCAHDGTATWNRGARG